MSRDGNEAVHRLHRFTDWVSRCRTVTLSLPETLVQRFRVFAATRRQSMTKLMAGAIQNLLEQESDRERVKRRLVCRVRNAADWGTGGTITWNRGELFERVR